MSQVSFQKRWRRTGRDPTPAADSPTASWKRNGDPQTSRSSHIDRGEISMGDYHSRRESTMEHRGKSTMEQNRASPSYRGDRWQAMAREGKIQSQTVMASPPVENVSLQKEAKMPKSDRMTHFKTLS